jgi:hypothetical protein
MSENNQAVTVTANALVKKRADLLFEISQREREIERLQTEIFWIDMLEDDDLTAAENEISHQQRTGSDNVWKLCEEYIKRNAELMVRPYILSGIAGEFSAIPDTHQMQLKVLCQNWRSVKANEKFCRTSRTGE